MTDDMKNDIDNLLHHKAPTQYLRIEWSFCATLDHLMLLIGIVKFFFYDIEHHDLCNTVSDNIIDTYILA